jgi:hypothetical protein
VLHRLEILKYETKILTVIWDRVLRKIFGPERDNVPRGWRKMHKEELHILYPLLNIIDENEKGGVYSAYRRDEKCVQNFGWTAQREQDIQKT